MKIKAHPLEVRAGQIWEDRAGEKYLLTYVGGHVARALSLQGRLIQLRINKDKGFEGMSYVRDTLSPADLAAFSAIGKSK